MSHCLLKHFRPGVRWAYNAPHPSQSSKHFLKGLAMLNVKPFPTFGYCTLPKKKIQTCIPWFLIGFQPFIVLKIGLKVIKQYCCSHYSLRCGLCHLTVNMNRGDEMRKRKQ